MKTLLCIGMIWILCNNVTAQSMKLIRGNEAFPISKIEENIWLVQIDGEDYLILPRSKVDSLTKKVLTQKAIIERHEKVLAAQDSLLKKYESFNLAAKEHIATQEKLIQKADSLYVGYKSLYNDLKKAIGLFRFGLTAGIGLVNPPEISWRPVGSLGITIDNWHAQYQFGKNYSGLIVGIRWPFGF